MQIVPWIGLPAPLERYLKHLSNETKTSCLGYIYIYVLGSKLPLLLYNRGWSSTQFRRGLYTQGFPTKGWMTIPNTRSLDPGSYRGLYYTVIWGLLAITIIRIPIKEPGYNGK